jgi:hypothetical protein
MVFDHAYGAGKGGWFSGVEVRPKSIDRQVAR